MKVETSSESHLKFFSKSSVIVPLRKEKVNNSVVDFDTKSYQKLILILIALSTILIFPELPRQSEVLCESYNSSQSCNVW